MTIVVALVLFCLQWHVGERYAAESAVDQRLFTIVANVDRECWSEGFTSKLCCRGIPGVGNPTCWDSSIGVTFDNCCPAIEASTCLREYIAGFARFFRLSRGPTHCIALDYLGVFECGKQMDIAEATQKLCEEVGGTLFELHWSVLWQTKKTGRPRRGLLCIPSSCSDSAVEDEVVPYYAAVNSLVLSDVRAVRLGHWASIELDFAIVGFGGCGTSSVRQNLQQHPELYFVGPESSNDPHGFPEDGLFWHMGKMVLPPAALVTRFNNFECCSSTHPDHRGEIGGRTALQARRGKRVLRGEKNPAYIFDQWILNALTRIPNLRILVIVCDPVDRVLTEFYRWSHKTPTSTVSVHEWLLENGTQHSQFARWIGLLLTVIPTALIMHRDVLSAHPRDSYDDLVRFLGVLTFPGSHRFVKANVNHRRDRKRERAAFLDRVCQSPDLRQRLTGLWDPEYDYLLAALAMMGQLAPPSLISRRYLCQSFEGKLRLLPPSAPRLAGRNRSLA